MFIKPQISNPQVPYTVLVKAASFAPGLFYTERYQEVADHFKGIEYFADDTSLLNVYFTKHDPDLKLFTILIDWKQFAIERKIVITNLDGVVQSVLEYLFWDNDMQGLDKDLFFAYSKDALKVFLVTYVEEFLSDLTKLPCYSDYTWLKRDNAAGAEEFDADRIYVVYS